MAAIVEQLRRLEKTPVNADAIVTKLSVAFENDGVSRARKFARELRDAGAVEATPRCPGLKLLRQPLRPGTPAARG